MAYEETDTPEVLACAAGFYALIQATVKFKDRDRRRLKREQLKAFAKARKETNNGIR